MAQGLGNSSAGNRNVMSPVGGAWVAQRVRVGKDRSQAWPGWKEEEQEVLGVKQ